VIANLVVAYGRQRLAAPAIRSNPLFDAPDPRKSRSSSPRPKPVSVRLEHLPPRVRGLPLEPLLREPHRVFATRFGRNAAALSFECLDRHRNELCAVRGAGTLWLYSDPRSLGTAIWPKSNLKLSKVLVINQQRLTGEARH